MKFLSLDLERIFFFKTKIQTVRNVDVRCLPLILNNKSKEGRVIFYFLLMKILSNKKFTNINFFSINENKEKPYES